jgi:LysM repeat protein
MRRLTAAIFTIALILYIFSPILSVDAKTSSVQLFSTAYELLDAVNALRINNGLTPYNVNAILMGTAQNQAEYNLSIGQVTHISADGSRPFQRALQAGYPVAGDLSQNGFFSENIVYGELTAEGAVEDWMGDYAHQNTMLSNIYQDAGAGVAYSGYNYYYVLDAGLSTGGTPENFTPQPSYGSPVTSSITNTPNPDGSIDYMVQPGDVLGAIAEVYKVSLEELRSFNNLTNDFIYPKQVLIIRGTYTPTATATPTKTPTITPWPTSTITYTPSPIPPTPIPTSGLQITAARGTVLAIIGFAFVMAALFTLLGRNHKS